MNYTITEQVHVDIRIDGQTISADYTPGDIEIPIEIGDLLIAQGLATLAPATGKKSKSTEPTNPEA